MRLTVRCPNVDYLLQNLLMCFSRIHIPRLHCQPTDLEPQWSDAQESHAEQAPGVILVYPWVSESLDNSAQFWGRDSCERVNERGTYAIVWISMGFSGGASGEEPTCQRRRHTVTWVLSLGREDALEKEMATHSSIFAWKIPWAEEPGRLLGFMGLQKVGHDWGAEDSHAHPEVSTAKLFMSDLSGYV